MSTTTRRLSQAELQSVSLEETDVGLAFAAAAPSELSVAPPDSVDTSPKVEAEKETGMALTSSGTEDQSALKTECGTGNEAKTELKLDNEGAAGTDNNQLEAEKEGEPAPAGGPLAYSPGRLALVFLALAMCVLLSALDITIVSTAMPTIVSELNGADLYAWVAISYILSTVSVQPLYGKLSDIVGRKAAMITALTIFLGGSAICGASVNMLMLVIARAVQGLGGGGIQTMVFIIISEIVSPRQRGKYQGMIGAVFGLASVIGPLLGGVFTQYTTWRWAFFINLPVGFLSLVAVVFFLKVPSVPTPWRESVNKIDWLGGLTIVAAGVLTCLALEFGGKEYPWSSAPVLVCLIIGILLFPVFAWVELKYAKDPIIPMQLFTNKNLLFAELAAFFQGGVFFLLSYYLPLWFQVVRGVSATMSGIQTLPFMLGVVFCAIGSGLVMTKFGIYVPVAQVGAALLFAATPLIAIWTPSSSTGQEIGTMIMAGMGNGLQLQTLLLTVQANAPLKDIGPATSSIVFVRTLGGVFGIAIFSAVFTNGLQSQLPAGAGGSLTDLTGINNLPPALQTMIKNAFAYGLRMAYFAMTSFAGLDFVSTLFIRHRELSNELASTVKEKEKPAQAEA